MSASNICIFRNIFKVYKIEYIYKAPDTQVLYSIGRGFEPRPPDY